MFGPVESTSPSPVSELPYLRLLCMVALSVRLCRTGPGEGSRSETPSYAASTLLLSFFGMLIGRGLAASCSAGCFSFMRSETGGCCLMRAGILLRAVA